MSKDKGPAPPHRVGGKLEQQVSDLTKRVRDLERAVSLLMGTPFDNEDPRYPPFHPLSREKNEAARRSGQQVPKG